MTHQKKNRVNRMSQDHHIHLEQLPYYHCSSYFLTHAQCMTWHVNLQAQ